MDEAFCAVEMLYDADNRAIDYRFLEANPTFEKHTGFKDAVGRTIRELVPDHDAHWFEIYGKVAATGEPTRFVNEAKAMGRWYDVYAYRVGGPGSRKVGILFTDITDRKRAEEAQARLAAIVESSDDAIVSKTLDGVITSWNKGAQRLFGYTAEETVGQPITLIIPHERHDEEFSILDRLRRGERVEHFETVRVAKDGRRLDVSLTISPIRDANGRIIGASKVGRDITDRKRAEIALRESEQRFRQLADAMPQIVWTARPDGNIDYLNRRWTEFTGLPETVGNDGWGPILHPDDAPPAGERWAASVATGAPFEMEIRLLDRRQQTYRWHLIRTVAVHDERGKVARWFGTSTDIHEQKRAEESSRYLAEASAALAGVVDYESTLQKVANLAVPYFADWSAVDVANDDGSLRRLAVAHQDPDKIRPGARVDAGVPARPASAGRRLRRPPHGQAGDRRRDHRRNARAGGEGRATPAPDPFAGPEVLHLRAAGRLRQHARRPHVRHRRIGPQVHRGRPRPGDGLGAPGGGRHREHPALPGASGNRPPQGRVPGDPGPRAAQPAGPDPQLAANPQDAEGRCGDGRAVTGHDGAAGPSSRPAGGRPAGRVPGHAGQDRTPQGAGRTRHGRRPCGRDGAAARRRPGARVERPPAARIPAARRRPGAAGPGRRQPADERRQVHGAERPHLADGRTGRRHGGAAGPGQRHRHRPAHAAPHLRVVRAGGPRLHEGRRAGWASA